MRTRATQMISKVSYAKPVWSETRLSVLKQSGKRSQPLTDSRHCYFVRDEGGRPVETEEGKCGSSATRNLNKGPPSPNPFYPSRQLDHDQMDWLPCRRCVPFLVSHRSDRQQSLQVTTQNTPPPSNKHTLSSPLTVDLSLRQKTKIFTARQSVYPPRSLPFQPEEFMTWQHCIY